jgi:hypothetical protein
MPFLATEALDLDHRQPLNADVLKGFLHLVELEGLDDRFDLFHAASSATLPVDLSPCSLGRGNRMRDRGPAPLADSCGGDEKQCKVMNFCAK